MYRDDRLSTMKSDLEVRLKLVDDELLGLEARTKAAESRKSKLVELIRGLDLLIDEEASLKADGYDGALDGDAESMPRGVNLEQANDQNTLNLAELVRSIARRLIGPDNRAVRRGDILQAVKAAGVVVGGGTPAKTITRIMNRASAEFVNEGDGYVLRRDAEAGQSAP